MYMFGVNQKSEICKHALKQVVVFCLWVVAARFSGGISLFFMMAMGIAWAFKGRVGKALGIHTLITFMCVLNPHILDKSGTIMGIGLRGGPLLIGLSLVAKELSTRCTRRLPLDMMLVFLVVAGISSLSGWCPKVSFLKLFNFLIFFLGLWLGTKGLFRDDREIFILRSIFLALAAFLIVGSLVLKAFPGISTVTAMRQMGEVNSIAELNETAKEWISRGNLTLFCGVTFHSQALSPLLVCAFAWILFDSLFVEGRIRWLHGLLLLGALPMLYLTRSRVALLGLMVALVFAYTFLPKKIKLAPILKRHLRLILFWGGVLLVAVVAVMECKDKAISKWVRKTENLEGDRRTMTEAVTDSRQGLLNMSLDDFNKNPFLGMGFQVAWYTNERAENVKGLLLSSPIEKGVLPVMVLGETGILGAIVFVFYLIAFYIGCSSRQLFVTIAMMGIFLAINMGEATYFSPGGVGGIEWMFCVVGGYILDLSFLNAKSDCPL